MLPHRTLGGACSLKLNELLGWGILLVYWKVERWITRPVFGFSGGAFSSTLIGGTNSWGALCDEHPWRVRRVIKLCLWCNSLDTVDGFFITPRGHNLHDATRMDQNSLLLFLNRTASHRRLFSLCLLPGVSECCWAPGRRSPTATCICSTW